MNNDKWLNVGLIIALAVSLGFNGVQYFQTRPALPGVNLQSCAATLREIEGEFARGRFVEIPVGMIALNACVGDCQ